VALAVAHLPSMYKALGSISSTTIKKKKNVNYKCQIRISNYMLLKDVNYEYFSAVYNEYYYF
jgi:hypothetical protein